MCKSVANSFPPLPVFVLSYANPDLITRLWFRTDNKSCIVPLTPQSQSGGTHHVLRNNTHCVCVCVCVCVWLQMTYHVMLGCRQLQPNYISIHVVTEPPNTHTHSHTVCVCVCVCVCVSSAVFYLLVLGFGLSQMMFSCFKSTECSDVCKSRLQETPCSLLVLVQWWHQVISIQWFHTHRCWKRVLNSGVCLSHQVNVMSRVPGESGCNVSVCVTKEKIWTLLKFDLRNTNKHQIFKRFVFFKEQKDSVELSSLNIR